MRLLLVSFVVLLFACTTNKDNSQITTANYFNYGDTGVRTAGIKMIPIHTPKGTFQVWTKRFGNNPRIKVLLLHGGPAMTHEYMEAFQSYFPQEGFEFYEYDQLGSYYSDQPDDSSLWVTERFVEEVEQVRKAIGADASNFYVLGNSWGGILGMEYALKYQQHMKGLIVCNMMASIPQYAEYNKVLRADLRPSFIDSVNQYEARNAYDDTTYQNMVFTEYYTKHLCRLNPMPEPVLRTFKHVNPSIYVLMQGPSEFKVGGRLLTWDRMADLKNITVPTLMVGARYDTMDPNVMEAQSKMVQNGSYLYCPNGSHLAMWDDQKVFMEGVISWIKKVDAEK